MKTYLIQLFGIAALAGTLIASDTADAKVIVKKSTSYYNVKGHNGVAIAKGLTAKGPGRVNLRHAIAGTITSYDVSDPKFAVKGRKCVIEDIKVTVNIKYIIPRWTGGKKASKEVRTSWKQFQKLVIAHEHKHGEISERAARDLEKKYKSLRGNVAIGCRDFWLFARSKFSSIARKMNNRHKLFDAKESLSFAKVRKAQKRLYRSK